MVKLSGKGSLGLSARVAEAKLPPGWLVSNVKTFMAFAETANQERIKRDIIAHRQRTFN